MSKTTTYVLIGGVGLVAAYFIFKNMGTTTPTTVVKTTPTTAAANSSTVETAGINDATSILNNIL